MQPQQLTETTIRQLSLIKYMFQQGVTQSYQPSPLFVVAILNFQDAAELFLHLACQTHNVDVPKQVQFLDYWKLLGAAGPVRHQTGMDRLNKARVAFKHHGNLPNEQDMEFFRVTAASFLEENTVVLFGTTFAEISLVDLIQSSESREQLTNARKAWSARSQREASAALAVSFACLMKEHSARNNQDSSNQIESWLGPSMKFHSTRQWQQQDRQLRAFADTAANAIDSLQSAVRILALGIDYRRFIRFRTLTPAVDWNIAGGAHVGHIAPGLSMSAVDFDFCFNFVIESAIKLQQFNRGAKSASSPLADTSSQP